MQIDIFDISHSGSGVGKVDGKVAFVKYTDIGEKVECRLKSETSKFANFEVMKVLKPSKFRIEPRCQYFSVCGGCDFQHLKYDRELELKKIILKNELKKVNFCGDIEIVKCSKRFNYRNKIKLAYFNGKLGYNLEKSHEFLEIESCPLADDKISYAIQDVKVFLKNNHFKYLKNVYFRSCDKNVLITFLFSQKEKFEVDENLKKYSVFKAIGATLESDKTKIFKLCGNNQLFKTFNTFKFNVDAKSFMQVNDEIAFKLYDEIISLTSGQNVINAYSGQGLLSVLLSTKCQHVVGIEMQKSAHEIAEKIKTQNVTNLNGKVEDILPNLVKKQRYDTIILDPAREGCKKEVLSAIENEKIHNIIYISCNFPSLIRDLKLLDNYQIELVEIFDMFPNTANMEVLAKLCLK